MKRGRKILLIALATVVVVGGILGGTMAAMASDDEPAATPPETPLLAKIAEIYERNTGTAIDADQLQQAFTEAREELRVQARETMMQRLVEDGVITQEEADEWQGWMNAQPDIPALQNGERHGRIPGPMFRDRMGGFGGFGGSGGFGPAECPQ